MAAILVDWDFQSLDSNGNPNSAGTLTFYDSGTTTLKTVYSDADLVTPIDNPVTLDASGKLTTLVYVANDAQYAILEQDSNGGTIRSRDPVWGKTNRIGATTDVADYASTAAAVTAAVNADIGLTFSTDASPIVNVGSSGHFTDLQSALDHVAKWSLHPGVDVTISLAAQTFALTTQIVLDIPYAQQISIEGSALTSAGSIASLDNITSNGAGDHDVTVDVTGHGLAVGDYFSISSSNGSGGYRQLEGVWRVTVVNSANQFTFKCTSQNTSFPATTVTAGTVQKYNTILSFTGTDIQAARLEYPVDPGGLEVVGRNFNVSNLLLLSDGNDADAHGIMLRHYGHLRADNVGIHGFAGNGIWCLYQSHLESASGLVISNNAVQGMAASELGHILASSPIINGNASSGARARSGGSRVNISGGTIAGNASGATAEDGSLISVASGLVTYNSGNGATIEGAAQAYFTSTSLTANGGIGLQAKEGAAVDITSATISANTGATNLDIDDATVYGTPTSVASSASVNAHRGGYIEALTIGDGTNSITMFVVSGTPEGQTTGSVGDVAFRVDGGASTVFYVKESGSATDTGWAGK